MKLVVTSPMYWPNLAAAQEKAWLYLASARKAGVESSQLRPYGIGSTFYHGTAAMRVYEQIQVLKQFESEGEFTHVLFSDAWDVLFVQPLEVLVEKYNKMGRPPFLVSACPRYFGFLDVHEADKFEHLFDLTKPFCFPATNFHIGEIGYIAEQLAKVPEGAHNESYAMIQAFEAGMELQMDHECEIFQEAGIHNVHRKGEGDPRGTCVRGGKVFNSVTGTEPCMVHFGGGYTSPETGKDESIKPWARELGIIE